MQNVYEIEVQNVNEIEMQNVYEIEMRNKENWNYLYTHIIYGNMCVHTWLQAKYMQNAG